jgi:hypothetical protein
MNTTLVMVAVGAGAIALLCYFTFLAINWFLDAEHRALQRWLDDHSKQLEDDK